MGNKRVIIAKPSSYQPSKGEVKNPIEFPEGTTPEDLARAVFRAATSPDPSLRTGAQKPPQTGSAD